MVIQEIASAAEQDGFSSYHRQAMTRRGAEEISRRKYRSVIECEAFVGGWNRARWNAMDGADEAMRPGVIDADNSPA